MRAAVVAWSLAFGWAAKCPAADLAMLRNGFTIRHERREVIGDITRLYVGSADAGYVDVPTASIERFEKDLFFPAAAAAPVASGTPVASDKSVTTADLTNVVNAASAASHLDPDLVNSVIRAESGFNTHAVSRKGAVGLMQLMPGTAGKLGVEDLLDPKANVTGGTRYLRQLLERYNFDLVKALAAYNAGPLRVQQYRGVPPYRETRAYVNGIVREYNRKKLAQEKAEAATAKANKIRKSLASHPASVKIPINSAD
jgi:soluble lytic murein transglycosylase-like protein